MRVGIVGSRSFRHLERVAEFLFECPADTMIVSGGARGVDAYAELIAKALNLRTVIYKADWSKHGRGAGIIRNTKIINNSDAVLAFWNGKSKGTLDSIKKAYKAGKCPVIYSEE